MARGLTQRALAGLAGISTTHYQDIAYARANPTLVVLMCLADALRMSIGDVLKPITPDPDAASGSDSAQILDPAVVAGLTRLQRHLKAALDSLGELAPELK